MRKFLWLVAICAVLYLGYSYYTQSDTTIAPTHAQSVTHARTTVRGVRTAPRVNQLDPDQYYPTIQDYSLWSPSTCSSAAMTSVINYYGHSYKLGDILKVEAGLGEITPDLGLVEPQGIAKTVAVFGFSARYLYKQTVPLSQELNQVLNIANGGHPIIVAFPPDTFPPGGHIFVVNGSTMLYYQGKMERHLVITDSSSMKWRFMPEENFMRLWQGFAVEVYPKGTHA